ncbi:hypothetical protein EYF80_034066 [Liparis tanakae]|uniref:Uncharacterized protein n=1 Tax=Liparis tanakae TaxID=230148 RepID=A0A4Z2GQX7_9TELE|nr:hypothetical protein EYF80_034066 [Liparis tanakae]
MTNGSGNAAHSAGSLRGRRGSPTRDRPTNTQQTTTRRSVRVTSVDSTLLLQSLSPRRAFNLG